MILNHLKCYIIKFKIPRLNSNRNQIGFYSTKNEKKSIIGLEESSTGNQVSTNLSTGEKGIA